MRFLRNINKIFGQIFSPNFEYNYPARQRGSLQSAATRHTLLWPGLASAVREKNSHAQAVDHIVMQFTLVGTDV
jgi:hypothetical protein